jgi:ABC-type branched-subunit amino acid transport system permease subunit
MIYGAILVLVITFLPRGLVGVFRKARRPKAVAKG